MFVNLKFPLSYLLEALLWPPLIAAFYGVVSFVAAKPVASLQLQGKALPPSWEAAVPNHGGFLQGYLISSNPVAFAAIVAAAAGCAFLLYHARRAQAAQRVAVGPAGAKAHLVANACLIAWVLALGYLFMTRVVVGISAT